MNKSFIKVHIVKGESYPTYGVSQDCEHEKWMVELTDQEISWCRYIENEYHQLQDFLSRKYDEQWISTNENEQRELAAAKEKLIA
jgi:hypothetical protein